MGDINIDVGYPGYNDLIQLMDVFDLTNLINEKTCFASDKASTIEIILTNRPKRFFKSTTFELGISDVHKLICTSLRQYVSRLKPKTIQYRSTKNFDLDGFRSLLKTKIETLSNIESNSDINCDTFYNMLVDAMVISLDKYAPIKTKTIRGNHNRFMRKDLSKAIMNRSRLKAMYNKNRTPQNRAQYKRQRNYCTYLNKKSKKEEFEKASTNFKTNSKPFYKLVRPFISNKGQIENSDITLAENEHIITDTNEIVDIFNNYYINIVELTSGKAPSNVANEMPKGVLPTDIIDQILCDFRNHPSVKAIRTQNVSKTLFSFKEVKEEDIYKLLLSIDHTKSTGEDNIPPKFIKSTADLLVKPFTKMINKSIKECFFPTRAKIATVLPLFKSLERVLKKNYRPVSVLSTFSKVLERVIKSQMVPYTDSFLSKFVSAYRKNYSAQHVLMRLIEEWRHNLDCNLTVGAVLMDLSKAFDCIPHDLLIAKLDAYGFSKEALIYIYSYLKGRKQGVKIDSIVSDFLEILSGVPQGSILGPILFNIFINDIFMFINDASLHGFADDHTLSAAATSLDKLITILSKESVTAVDWLTNNHMIANPSKFQAIILNKSRQTVEVTLAIKEKVIQTQNEIKLLGVTIDNKLNFEKHISNMCSRAGGQLNTLYRLSKFMSTNTIKAATSSFVMSNFNYCPLVWHFTTAKSNKKIEKIQERALRLSNDHNLTYQKLLTNTGKCTMELCRLKYLCIEIYKTLNGSNPSYMREIF